jgi:hypothetical protein
VYHHVLRTGEWNGAYRVLEEVPEGKRPTGKHKRSWEENIKIDLKEIIGETVDWFDLAQVREG